MGYHMSERMLNGVEQSPKARKPDAGGKEQQHEGFFRMLAASRGGRPEDIDIKKDVGNTAGEVYNYLEKNGESHLRDIRAAMENRGPLFMAALGWLLREDKVDMRLSNDGVRVKLK